MRGRLRSTRGGRGDLPGRRRRGRGRFRPLQRFFRGLLLLRDLRLGGGVLRFRRRRLARHLPRQRLGADRHGAGRHPGEPALPQPVGRKAGRPRLPATAPLRRRHRRLRGGRPRLRHGNRRGGRRQRRRPGPLRHQRRRQPPAAQTTADRAASRTSPPKPGSGIPGGALPAPFSTTTPTATSTSSSSTTSTSTSGRIPVCKKGKHRSYCDPDTYDPVEDVLYRNGRRPLHRTSPAPAASPWRAAASGGAVGLRPRRRHRRLRRQRRHHELPLRETSPAASSRSGCTPGAVTTGTDSPKPEWASTSATCRTTAGRDLFVTNFTNETNTLYVNDGQGELPRPDRAFRLTGPSLKPLGFGTRFLDYDNDGFLDLFVANGPRHGHHRRGRAGAQLPAAEPGVPQPRKGRFRRDLGTGRPRPRGGRGQPRRRGCGLRTTTATRTCW